MFDHRAFGCWTCPLARSLSSISTPTCARSSITPFIDRTALVCQPLGGNTGMRMAIKRPHQVAALTLACTLAGLVIDEVRYRRNEHARFGSLAEAHNYLER